MSKFSQLGHDLYTGRRSIDFAGRRWLWYSISGLIMAFAALGLFFKPLDLGIEFVGGSEFRATLPAGQVNQDTADELREAVAGTGIDNASAPVVTTSGDNAILIQTESLTSDERATVTDAIVEVTGIDETADLSINEIGASWGKDVAQRAQLGLGIFLVVVVLFIWAYFREWKMSVAALVALVHDVLITVGVYAWSGFEVTPATVTGLLTILGFSLYDTVVVFDKVKENTANLLRSHMSYTQAANLAVNQTLVRSINTTVVALLPVAAILYVGVTQLGSGSLKDLALALFVGMAAGAYSSIFIATPLLVQLKEREADSRVAASRAQAKRRNADRYANVGALANAEDRSSRMAAPDVKGQAPVAREGEAIEAAPAASAAADSSTGIQGRVVPTPVAPVEDSTSSGRPQPTRKPRSKRGKK